jgi:hypothetical protein
MSAPIVPQDRTAYREAVAQIAQKAKAKLPECNGRIDAAVQLVLLGEVALLPDGTATVGSCTDPTKAYTVNGTCSCKDYQQAPHQFCKHKLSVAIAKRVRELLPQTPDQDYLGNLETPATLPLPEAPASVNVRLTIAGREVQLTLRDTSEERLLVRLEEVLQRYPQPQAPPARQDQGKGWCPIHHVQMTQNTKQGRTWWSHQTDQGWCKGR